MTSITLAEWIAGDAGAQDRVRMVCLLGDLLRQWHEDYGVHGSLSPSRIAIFGDAPEILPPAGEGEAPYAAPEIGAGHAADQRSDIYSFGAIVYEMFAGKFPTNSAAVPPRTGHAALDAMTSACLATSPDARYPSMQKLMLDLRLLRAAARRVPLPTPVRASQAAAPASSITAMPTPGEATSGAFASELHDLEERITARLARQEKSVTDIANQVLIALRAHTAAVPVPPPVTEFPRSAAQDDVSATRLDRTVNLIAEKLSRMDVVLTSVVDRLQRLEQNLEAFDTDAAELRDSVTRDVRNFERALKSNHAMIESTRTAMGQTDDLVERVVEALDTLQSMIIAPDQQTLAS